MRQVVPEPVDKWQNITDTAGGEPVNLLEAFYNNPERYAYTFQNYVFVTRLMQARCPPMFLSSDLAFIPCIFFCIIILCLSSRSAWAPDAPQMSKSCCR